MCVRARARVPLPNVGRVHGWTCLSEVCASPCRPQNQVVAAGSYNVAVGHEGAGQKLTTPFPPQAATAMVTKAEESLPLFFDELLTRCVCRTQRRQPVSCQQAAAATPPPPAARAPPIDLPERVPS